MAKCKNCYHYEACLYFLAKENKILNNSEGFVCGYYKDKSLIVELPCRIGDTVFIISRGDIINLTVNNISYSSYRRFLICKNEEHFGYGTVTLDPHFILIWLIFFLNISAGLSLISVASPMLKSLNITPKTIAIIVSVMGTFNGVGRLVFSAISDKIKNRCTIYVAISGLAYIISGFAQTKSDNILVSIALIIVSACYGAGFSCLPSLLSDIFGMQNISKIHGITLTAWAVAGLIGNQISSFVFEEHQSYLPVFSVLIIIYMAQLLLSFILKGTTKTNKHLR